MSFMRLPILTIVALALALWLQHFPSAFAKGPAGGEGAHARKLSSDPTSPIDLSVLTGSDHYMDLAKAVGGKDVSWDGLKSALVELNISIPPIASALSTRMWDLAPSPDKRLDWVKSTDWVITINKYIAQSHSTAESTFLKVNKEFRTGVKPAGDEEKFVTDLRAAMLKLPPVQGYVFRGAMVPEADLKSKYIVGKVASEPAFSSATINPSTAYSFAFPKEQGFYGSKLIPLPEGSVRVMYVILSKLGRPVSYYSDYWAEAEILFANGTDFNVKAVSAKQADGSVYIVLEEK